MHHPGAAGQGRVKGWLLVFLLNQCIGVTERLENSGIRLANDIYGPRRR
jgi:hypothetical protein